MPAQPDTAAAKAERPSGPGRRLVLGSCAVFLTALLGLWWRYWPPPLRGGGHPDSPAALWVLNRSYASISPGEEDGFARLTAQNATGWYSLFSEVIQTEGWYRSQNPTRPTALRHTIVLQPLGPVDAALLANLKVYCGVFFQLPVRVQPPLPLSLARAWTRRGARRRSGPGDDGLQYDADALLSKVLVPRLPADAAAYLGITMSDLWAGDLSFNFGLANLAARTGVYSLCRYGTFETNSQVLRRACMVLNHETGHMFGLTHCVLFKCSMNGCNSLAICRRKLIWNIGFEPAIRNQQLYAFYMRRGLAGMGVGCRGLASNPRRRVWQFQPPASAGG